MGAIIAIAVLGGGVWLLLRYLDGAPTINDPDPDKVRRDSGRAQARRAAIERYGGRGDSGAAQRHTVTRYVDGEVVGEADMENWADAQPYLRIQVASPMYGLVDADAVVAWELAEGLRALLVFDFGASETNVGPKTLARWGVSRDDVWALALDNSAAHAVPQMEQYALQTPEGVHLADLSSSPSCFAAACGLKLFENLGGEGVESVVALPSWCNIVHRTVESSLTVAIVQEIAKLASGIYDEAATPGVRDVYWHHDGAYVRLEFEETEAGLVLAGPSAFVQRLG